MAPQKVQVTWAPLYPHPGDGQGSSPEGDDSSAGVPIIQDRRSEFGVHFTNEANNTTHRACEHCRQRKQKCCFDGDTSCTRCKANGYECVITGRKPRSKPQQDSAQLQIQQKDAMIQKLKEACALLLKELGKSSDIDTPEQLDMLLRDLGREGSSSSSNDERPTNESFSSMPNADGSPTGISNSLPDADVPIGLLAQLTLTDNADDIGDPVPENDHRSVNPYSELGVANKEYFQSGELKFGHHASAATYLWNQVVLVAQSPVRRKSSQRFSDVTLSPWQTRWFYLNFFTNGSTYVMKRWVVHHFTESHQNFITLLDSKLHSAQSTLNRSPFLFTAVCAVTLRFHETMADRYSRAMQCAKRAAAHALLDEGKSVELAQAFLILSVYPEPSKRWEDNTSWIYTGLATRIATDMNLHRPTTYQASSDEEVREILNRERLWLNCFNVERSLATQFGKPSAVSEDRITKTSDAWYRKSHLNHPWDAGICAYTQLFRFMGQFHDRRQTECDAAIKADRVPDFRALAEKYNEYLEMWSADWDLKLHRDTDMNDASCRFRANIVPYALNYSRLVIHSFAFHQAFSQGMSSEDQPLFTMCLESAENVVRYMVTEMLPSRFMRYSSDGHFLYATFAAGYLLKLMRPEFEIFVDDTKRIEIYQLVEELIEALGSKDIVVDDHHTPKQHSQFLAKMLKVHRYSPRTPAFEPPAHLGWPYDATMDNNDVNMQGAIVEGGYYPPEDQGAQYHAALYNTVGMALLPQQVQLDLFCQDWGYAGEPVGTQNAGHRWSNGMNLMMPGFQTSWTWGTSQQ